MARSLSNLARLHWAQGNFDGALRLIERAGEIEEKQRCAILPIGSEREAQAYLAKSGDDGGAAAGRGAGGPGAPRCARGTPHPARAGRATRPGRAPARTLPGARRVAAGRRRGSRAPGAAARAGGRRASRATRTSGPSKKQPRGPWLSARRSNASASRPMRSARGRRRLSSGRDLLRLGLGGRSREGPLLVAAPDFDGAGASTEKPVPAQVASVALRSRDFAGMRFQPLPRTRDEAKALVKLLGVEALMGTSAREAAAQAGPRAARPPSRHSRLLPRGPEGAASGATRSHREPPPAAPRHRERAASLRPRARRRQSPGRRRGRRHPDRARALGPRPHGNAAPGPLGLRDGCR